MFKTSTPNYMIYGELGRYPVEIDIKIRIISFWAKIICGKQSKISCIMYSLSHHLKVCVCHILEKPVSFNIFFKHFIHLISKFCCEYKWCDKLYIMHDIYNSPKAFNHRIFKTDFKFEEYFNILDEQNSLLLYKFKTTNLDRWN
jgi:hypothetical protein